MPKQVRCTTNIVGDVDKGFAWNGLLFMEFKGQKMYINKNYFEPLYN